MIHSLERRPSLCRASDSRRLHDQGLFCRLVEFFMVDPEYRGKGYGGKLLNRDIPLNLCKVF